MGVGTGMVFTLPQTEPDNLEPDVFGEQSRSTSGHHFSRTGDDPGATFLEGRLRQQALSRPCSDLFRGSKVSSGR